MHSYIIHHLTAIFHPLNEQYVDLKELGKVLNPKLIVKKLYLYYSINYIKSMFSKSSNLLVGDLKYCQTVYIQIDGILKIEIC